jgi:hypothetical protein
MLYITSYIPQTDVPSSAHDHVTDIAAGDTFSAALRDGNLILWGAPLDPMVRGYAVY